MKPRDMEKSCRGSLFCLACSLPLPSSRAVPVSQECSQGRQGPLRSGVGVGGGGGARGGGGGGGGGGGEGGGGGRLEDGACVCVCVLGMGDAMEVSDGRDGL